MYKRCLIIWKQRITPKKLTFNQTPEYFRYLLNSWPSMDIWVGQDYAPQPEEFASQLALTLLIYHTPLMKSLDSSAPFLDMTHNSSSCYTPLPTGPLTSSSFASCHSLPLLTLSQKVMWQLSESDKSAAPRSPAQPGKPAVAQRRFCRAVQSSTSRCLWRSPHSPPGRQGDNSETCSLALWYTLCQHSYL